MGVSSAQEVIDILTHSERACSELELKLELQDPPQPVSIILREWIEFDPATEFRGFVSRDKLTGLSPMATMDVVLHYPQVEPLISKIQTAVQEFFNRIRADLEFITQSGPSDKYVLDVFYDLPNDRCYLVEINPFQTSSSGHLFKFWEESDLNTLTYGPFEFRLSSFTPSSALDDVPDLWKQRILEHDKFDMNETMFQSLEEEKSKRSKNFLALFRSGENTDGTVKVGKTIFPVHIDILSARSELFREKFEDPYGSGIPLSDIKFSAEDISPSSMKQLLEFVYVGDDISAWECDDWNSLFMSLLNLDCADITERMIQWRETQAGGSDSKQLHGNPNAKIIPGWKFPSDQGNDALSFSFEVEGNGLQILHYYRPEYIAEAKWLSMSLVDRYNAIDRNWAALKRRIDDRAFYWMNKNLTIEDSGFLWEISYGGDSAGYCLDLDHLLEQYELSIDSGLSIADRFMDSGIQMHIAFPFFNGDTSVIRESVLNLMIHLDDFAFLNHFPQYIYDDCNNLWSDEDIRNLFSAHQQGFEVFESYVSQKGMPNPAVKHKHIGLRGVDTYKVQNRFGFEFRRGFQTEELAPIVRYISSVLEQIGKLDEVLLRFNWLDKIGKSQGSRREYRLRDVTDWIHSLSRVCPHNGLDSNHADLLLEDKLISVAEPWINSLIKWEYHLINMKNLLWGKQVGAQPHDADFELATLVKLKRRLAFVLLSDWSKFPSPCDSKSKVLLESLVEEQQFIRNRLNNVLGDSVRKNLLAQPPSEEIRKQLTADDSILIDVRDMIMDFAGRLARLY